MFVAVSVIIVLVDVSSSDIATANSPVSVTSVVLSALISAALTAVSYTHLRAHET